MKSPFDKKMLGTLVYWILERDRMRMRKERDAPKPWTDDKLLAMHRWCNVRRMDDKVSKWMLSSWYSGSASPRNVLLAAALGRLINWPDTLFELIKLNRTGGFTKWNAVAVGRRLHAWQRKGNKVFTGAYIINGAAGGNKIDQVVRHVEHMAITMLVASGRPLIHLESMEHTWSELIKCPGIGSFMAGQIVADMRHVLPGPNWWQDRMQWAPLGPGSTRGMRRLLGMEPRGAMRQGQFNELLPVLIKSLRGHSHVGPLFDERRLEAMDVQNCLCEFDKYVRLTNGEGHVRSKYPGGY